MLKASTNSYKNLKTNNAVIVKWKLIYHFSQFYFVLNKYFVNASFYKKTRLNDVGTIKKLKKEFKYFFNLMYVDL